MTISISFENTCSDAHIPDESEFQQWVDCAIQIGEHKPEETVKEVAIIIVDKNKSATLNETFRDKKGPTNVLAFTYDPIPGIETELLGDIVICADIVKEEATQQSIAINDHWAHLTIHGVLHLLGYNHIEPDEAVLMEGLETKALRSLGIENPYGEEDSPHV